MWTSPLFAKRISGMSTSDHQVPAGDGELGAGDVGGLVAREEERRVHHVAGGPEAPQRDRGDRLLDPRRVDGAYGLHRGVGEPRVDAVGADPVRGELHGEVASERDHRALAGRVGVLRDGVSEQRRGRTDVDDGTAAGLDQLRNAVLADPDDAFQVDRHHAVQDGLVGLQDAHVPVSPEHAGVVVEDVERSEALDRALDRPAHLALVGHVDNEGLEFATGASGHRRRLAQRGGVDVEGRDPRALAREHEARLAAHAAAGAGDQGYLAVEPSHQLATLYSRQRSGTPFSSCSPRSSNVRPDPATRSFTVCETSTSEGRDAAATRAPIATPMPATSSPSSSTSPVWRPARISRPSDAIAAVMADAQRTALAGPSNVARKPSPIVLISRPR